MEEEKFTDSGEDLHGNQSSKEDYEYKIESLVPKWLSPMPSNIQSSEFGRPFWPVDEDSNLCLMKRVEDSAIGLAVGVASIDYSLKISNESTANVTWQPVRAPTAGYTNDNSSIFEFLKLQEANNILKAAYKEIMTLAFRAKTWVVGIPAVGSVEKFLQMFRSSPPSGMRIEQSVETALVPISPENLIAAMMDMDEWPWLFTHIVHHGSEHVPTGVLCELRSTDDSIQCVKMVNAEFQLPTPFVPARKFCFLRCQKEIVKNVWAIIDVSRDYFPHTSSETIWEQQCRRRPSGVIIRRREEHSEVIWIENVEVHDCQEQNTFSAIVNSNRAFCALSWVNALSRKINQIDCRFINLNMHVHRGAHVSLLRLIDGMEKLYMDCVSEAPDESKWSLLSNKRERILRERTVNNPDALGSNNYIAITSFHLQAKPLAVFHLLVKKNMELQLPSLLNLEEPEEIIKFAKEDYSDCISLHRKVVSLYDSRKSYEYLLQEASKDEFCSFIISSPMAQSDVDSALVFGTVRNVWLKPSGFAIMPVGSGGLQSNACLVTIAMQQELDISDTGQATEVMCNLVNSIRKEINEAGKFL